MQQFRWRHLLIKKESLCHKSTWDNPIPWKFLKKNPWPLYRIFWNVKQLKTMVMFWKALFCFDLCFGEITCKISSRRKRGLFPQCSIHCWFWENTPHFTNTILTYYATTQHTDMESYYQLHHQKLQSVILKNMWRNILKDLQ